MKITSPTSLVSEISETTTRTAPNRLSEKGFVRRNAPRSIKRSTAKWTSKMQPPRRSRLIRLSVQSSIPPFRKNRRVSASQMMSRHPRQQEPLPPRQDRRLICANSPHVSDLAFRSCSQTMSSSIHHLRLLSTLPQLVHQSPPARNHISDAQAHCQTA